MSCQYEILLAIHPEVNVCPHYWCSSKQSLSRDILTGLNSFGCSVVRGPFFGNILEIIATAQDSPHRINSCCCKLKLGTQLVTKRIRFTGYFRNTIALIVTVVGGERNYACLNKSYTRLIGKNFYHPVRTTDEPHT